MPVYADRVEENTSTTGTGTLTLSGAVSSYQTFLSVFSTGVNRVFYCIVNGAAWEVGSGTYTSASTTLSRDTVYASSNANALVNLVGTSIVFLDLPAVAVIDKGTVQAFDQTMLLQ